MTTWTYPSRARIETLMARENDDNVLRETGDYLLIEDDYIPFWYESSKNTTTWSQQTKNNTTWSSPTLN